MSRSPRTGRTLTDWLARHLLGPAQVGDSREPARPTTEQEQAREHELRSTLVRVQDANGRTYLVERPDAGTDELRG
ncbi:hypothetical protein [Cellulomonas palmilytica]|uniref:hypothetical protein n=1 Tax=Cellulomonas palmilytica TaxID=2608402 RepID=UPI001F1FA956|nr:hypothetical protein [Cellulomonas palmilytica]UJP39641.1 hypothetical protein F1D97_15235 [Cellulomonas palmilytica]